VGASDGVFQNLLEMAERKLEEPSGELEALGMLVVAAVYRETGRLMPPEAACESFKIRFPERQEILLPLEDGVGGELARQSAEELIRYLKSGP